VRWTVFGAVALACFWRLDSTALNETDEGFAANRAWSMFRHDSIILTYDDVGSDEPQFHKPPLWYWIVGLSYHVLGYNLWAVRLPTALASFLLCLLLYRIHRTCFDDSAALAGAALLCAVPFALHHMRTAMLEVPVLLPSLLAMWVFARDSRRLRATVFSGVLCAALFLIKGPSGLVSMALVVVYGLLVRPFRWSLPRDAAGAACIMALLGGLYFAALPSEYRPEAFSAFFVREVGGRAASGHYGARAMNIAQHLLDNLRWHTVAGAAGLVLCLLRIREPAVRRWLALCALVCVPVFVIVSRLSVPYPRYVLPVYPFVVMLGAFFCFEVVRSRRAAWALLPFAALSLLLESTPLRWTPFLVACGILVVMQIAAARSAPWFRGAAAATLLAAVAVPSALSTAAARDIQIDLRHSRPELIPLAREAGHLVPEDEKVIVGRGFKCHRMLFYSQRALQTLENWLLFEFQPGSVRCGVFMLRDFKHVPFVEAESVLEIGAAQLVRLAASPDATNVVGIRTGSDSRLAQDEEALRLMGLPFERRGGTLIIGSFEALIEQPADGVQIVAEGGASEPGAFRVGKGHALVVQFPVASEVGSIEIVPRDKRQSLDGLRIEAFDAAAASWREIAFVRREPTASFAIRDGRLVRSRAPVLRVDAGRIKTDRIRVSKPEGREARLLDAKVFVTAPPS
jgi:4-amino-4-deoxy-L-arabinose transferase-like glycosyltransferase